MYELTSPSRIYLFLVSFKGNFLDKMLRPYYLVLPQESLPEVEKVVYFRTLDFNFKLITLVSFFLIYLKFC